MKRKFIIFFIISILVIPSNNLFANNPFDILDSVIQIRFGDLLFGMPYHSKHNRVAAIITFYLMKHTERQVENLYEELKLEPSWCCNIQKIPQKYINFNINQKFYDFSYLCEYIGSGMYNYKFYHQEFTKEDVHDNKSLNQLNNIYNWLLLMQEVAKYQSINPDQAVMMKNIKNFWLNYVVSYDRQVIILTGRLDLRKKDINKFELEIDFELAFPSGYMEMQFPKYSCSIDVNDKKLIDRAIAEKVNNFFILVRTEIKNRIE